MNGHHAVTRRDFFGKAAKHWWVGAVGSVAVLKYQAKEAKEDIDKMELRLRELEAYNTANVTKIQFLLSERK